MAAGRAVGAGLSGISGKGTGAVGAAGALSLPQQAVVLRDGFSYVFKLDAGSKVSQLKVQTGRRMADRVEITGGLKAGDEVVASGAAFLAEGDVVRVTAAPAPGKAPAAGKAGA